MGTDAWLQLTISMLIALAIALGALRLCGRPTKWSTTVIVVLWAIMAVGITLNVYQATAQCDATLTDPKLLNPDISRYWDQACALFERIPYPGEHSVPVFCYATAGIWWLFGKSLVYPLALNVTLTLISVVLVGLVSRKLLAGQIKSLSDDAVSALAMTLIAAVTNYVGFGMVMLREPSDYLGFMLASLCLVDLFQGRKITLKSAVAFIAGVALLACNRPASVCFIILGIVLLSIRGLRTQWKSGLVLTVVAVAAAVGGMSFTNEKSWAHVHIVRGDSSMGRKFIANNDTVNDYRYTHYNKLIGPYYNTPVLNRLSVLPITATVQAIVPFPWGFERDMKYGYTQAYNHVGYPWYAIAGIIAFYYLWLWWRVCKNDKTTPKNRLLRWLSLWRQDPLHLWALWALACWLVIAFLYAGSVSRYAMPMVQLLIPLAVVIIDRLKAGYDRKPFSIWATTYVVIMAAGLIICYHLQTNL